MVKMRVKIGETWYDAKETAICIELSGQDKDNIGAMHPDCTKYAAFPDECSMSADEMRAWMSEGSE